MIRPRTFSSIVITTALLCLVALYYDGSVTPPKANAADEKESAAEQIKELQKQVAELQKFHIVAAGTATWTRPDNLDNKTSVRVKLPADIAAKIGKDYIVLLTNRFPKGGYPFFTPYWKAATDGFDITLVDTSIGDGNSASYDTPNKSYLIDWIVIKK